MVLISSSICPMSTVGCANIMLVYVLYIRELIVDVAQQKLLNKQFVVMIQPYQRARLCATCNRAIRNRFNRLPYYCFVFMFSIYLIVLWIGWQLVSGRWLAKFIKWINCIEKVKNNRARCRLCSVTDQRCLLSNKIHHSSAFVFAFG